MGIYIVYCIFKNCLVFCVSLVILKLGKKRILEDEFEFGRVFV